ncbi:MAG: hypothetical protein JOY70_01270, partial [Acidisphaera sp.]|nr:hypothetical protein [Acidisphaera sp.]
MKPVRSARLVATDARGLSFDAGDDVQFRIDVLAADVVRVSARRGGAWRQPRTWMVPAHGADDVPW